MTNKVKGCRELSLVQQDFSNVAAGYGGALFRVKVLTEKEIPALENRLEELRLELKQIEDAKVKEMLEKQKADQEAAEAKPEANTLEMVQ